MATQGLALPVRFPRFPFPSAYCLFSILSPFCISNSCGECYTDSQDSILGAITMLLLLSFWLLKPEFVSGAPTQNLTALRTQVAPAWVANPSGRGTWDLLYSCTFTIFLCVYTAIHLNIPPEETKFWFWLRKTKWVFTAIFAPEIVVYTAFEQWMRSRKFLKDLNRIIENSTDDKFKIWAENYDSKHHFDIVYAQYALMGGFAANIEHLHNTIRERVTITPTGILFLARHGYCCRVKKGDIADKSKADILAKGLVCVQVLWMAGQAIERQIAGYPITLLEIHTLVHVVCAITMYALWMRKPLNVQDPTMVDFGAMPDVLAFMVEHSREPRHQRQQEHMRLVQDRQNFMVRFPGLIDFRPIAEEAKIVWYKDLTTAPITLQQLTALGTRDQPQTLSSIGSTSSGPAEEPIQASAFFHGTQEVDGQVTHFHQAGKIAQEYFPALNREIVRRMVSGESSPLGYGPPLPKQYARPEGEALFTEYSIDLISLSEKDILRLDSTAQFLARVKTSDITAGEADNSPFPDVTSAYTAFTHNEIVKPLLTIGVTNFSGRAFEATSENAYTAAPLALLPAVYGCIHIGALQLIFPSVVERLLWKISCFCLIGSAIACGIFILFLYLCDNIKRRWGVDIWKSFKKSKIVWLLGGVLYVLFIPVYCGARLYIVVESFISLRHVPVGAYQTPLVNFMNYIPHL